MCLNRPGPYKVNICNSKTMKMSVSSNTIVGFTDMLNYYDLLIFRDLFKIESFILRNK